MQEIEQSAQPSRYERSITALLVNLEIRDNPTVYVLKDKSSRSSKAKMRFFIVSGACFPRLVEITAYVHHITEYPMLDRGQVLAIHTHITNDTDIVTSLSEKLFNGDSNVLKLSVI